MEMRDEKTKRQARGGDFTHEPFYPLHSSLKFTHTHTHHVGVEVGG